MRLLTVLLFGMFLVATQIFLVLKAMQNNLFESNVDAVNALVERQKSIEDFLSSEEQAWLKAHPIINVGIDPDFYPMEMLDPEGNYVGIGPDYLRIIRKVTGLTFHVAPPSTWSDTEAKAASKQIDMYIAAAKTAHRAQYMLFTPTYINLPGIIITPRERKKGEPVLKNLSDFAGKRVAVVSRYAWHDFLEETHPEIIPVLVENTLEGLQKVAFGEVDGMIGYQFNITEKINTSGIRNLRVAGTLDSPYGHAFAVRKDWPELESILSKALAQIQPDERKILAHKWLQPYEEKTFSKQTVWLMLFSAEVLFAVFAFVLYWNFSLKRQVSRRTVQLKQELLKYDRAEKALRESRAMLEQSNQELEHRVNERTRDLQAINAELQLAKEAADAATVAKSQFLANISHEVRTPLHGIMAFAELALLKEKTPPHRYLRAILESSQALLEIINDLLDVSKIEAGHLELEQAPFMLDDVVHHVCTVALHNAQAGGIELLVDMDPTMQLALVGDAGRLQQIIMNLVTNAVKFTGPGGQICVSLRQARTDVLRHSMTTDEEKKAAKPKISSPQQVQIICFVRDTGVGIAPEFLGQLFQPFRQVDASTTRRHGGTGLGLCICRQLVEMMRGEIWVESEPDVGSTFAFSIPLTVQENADMLLPPTSTPEKGSPQALLLSASPLQAEILCRNFAALRIQTVVAVSCGEALEKIAETFQGRSPDLLFLDRKLIEPDTLTALRILRSTLGQTIPAILMDEHAGEQILAHSTGETQNKDGQVAILPIVTLRGLHEAVVSLNEPCLVAHSGRLHALPRPMETPLFHDAHILVAEDNPTNQEIMEALFEDTGIELTMVSNGKQALDALRVSSQRGKRFDLVLMDVQMPVMDGYEATRHIRTIPEFDGMPIVAITAHAMHEDKMRALSAGISRYLSKPLSRTALFGTLRALLPHKITSIRNDTNALEGSLSTPEIVPCYPQKKNDSSIPEGLDPEAIKRLNVSPSVYHKILRGFVRNTATALPTMRRLVFMEGTTTELPEPVWDTLIHEAHNLKGAAANVGAVAVQQAAKALEFAARDMLSESSAPSADASAPLFLSLFTELEATFSVIQASVEPVSEALPPSSSDAQLLHEVLCAPEVQQLRDVLIIADPDRIGESFTAVEKMLPSSLVAQLQNLIDSYDYDEALALLDCTAHPGPEKAQL